MATFMPWVNTRQVLAELQVLMKCGICHNMVQHPCSFGNCEHFFCSSCSQQYLGNVCPVCGVPAFHKNMQRYRQLETVASLCQHLDKLLTKSESSEPLVADSHDMEIAKDTKSVQRQELQTSKIEKSKRTKRQSQPPLKKNTANPVQSPDLLEKGASDPTDDLLKICEARKVLKDSVDKLPTEDFDLMACSKHNNTTGKPRKMLGNSNKTPANGKKCDKSHADDASKGANYEVSPELSAEKMTWESSSGSHNPQANNTPVNCASGRQSRRRSYNKRLPDDDVEALFTTPVPPKCQKSAFTPAAAQCPLERPQQRCRSEPKRKSVKSPLAGSGLCKRNARGETPLHTAAIKGNVETVKAILETGFNPDVKDNAGWTPLWMSVSECDWVDFCNCVTAQYLRTLVRSQHEACNRGFAAVASLLLDYGATVDLPGGDNETPLHDAMYNGRVDCVRLLVSNGASLTARDKHGKTPFDLAYNDALKEALQVPLTVASKKCTKLNTSISSLDGETYADKVVLLTTTMERSERKNAATMAKKLSWTVAENFTSHVTHLVALTDKDGSCKRTIKYLQAVAAGVWVVDISWLKECHEKKMKVAEEPYEVKGSTLSPMNYVPKTGRLNRERQLPGLFDGCHFYFYGEFGQPPSPSRDDLVLMVRLGGGVVHTREPKLHCFSPSELTVPYHAKVDSLLVNCSFFFVAGGADPNLTFLDKERRMCRVPPSWILNSIDEFCLVEKIDSV